MVELKLDSFDVENLPSDCYASVRIGEVQKLSKLSPGRVFRFPQVADARRFGKIEVFQRIGQVNVDVDIANEGMRDVVIGIKDHDKGKKDMRLKVDVVASQGKKSEVPEKQGATKVKAAKDYLNKHGLEVKLSEAMQAILREKPDDPTGFLAARLLGETGSVRARSCRSFQRSNRPTTMAMQRRS